MVYTVKKEVFEILHEFEKASNKKERLAVLETYKDVPAFTDVLRGTFDDVIQFELPEGKPPYTPNRPESVPSTLLKEHKKFGYFVRGGARDNPRYKIENMFIQMLESIHPDDALVVLNMVEKKPPVKFLTKKLVQQAYPKLISK